MAEGAPPHVIQARPYSGRVGYILRALVQALRSKPDAVFCGHLFMAPLAALIAMIARRPLLIQLHGIEAWPRPNPIIRWATRRADLVLCVSRDTRTRLLGWCDIAPERAVVVSNTVGEGFTPGDKAAARARWSLGPEPIILSVGRLDPRERYKGHDRIIAALAGLKTSPKPIYLIAGDGADQPRLAALAKAAWVEDRVRFLGQTPSAQLPDLYRAADLFALPSTGEGFGIVFLEAMACGTPALGLAAGGAVDPLSDGELGMAVTEAELPSALERGLAQGAPIDLHAQVIARFGRHAFNSRIAGLMKRLNDSTPPHAA